MADAAAGVGPTDRKADDGAGGAAVGAGAADCGTWTADAAGGVVLTAAAGETSPPRLTGELVTGCDTAEIATVDVSWLGSEVDGVGLATGLPTAESSLAALWDSADRRVSLMTGTDFVLAAPGVAEESEFPESRVGGGAARRGLVPARVPVDDD